MRRCECSPLLLLSPSRTCFDRFLEKRQRKCHQRKILPKLDKNQQTIQFKSTSSGSENSVTELSQTVANKVGENEAATELVVCFSSDFYDAIFSRTVEKNCSPGYGMMTKRRPCFALCVKNVIEKTFLSQDVKISEKVDKKSTAFQLITNSVFKTGC